ncbi:alpha-L-rhamnosidase C-terminal domain-containing protein, partial [Flavobacterium alvei]|uniref:alpha-L-rhamnosidase C-terminal domain-containing protein n=1 Tax=Flavobacterium alvei TaxID=2080416 RepID=UPI0026EC238B
IQPEIVGDMTFVKATYKSIYGNIASAWEKKDGKLILKVEVPANTSATIKFPVSKDSEIKVNGKPTKDLKLGSGKYTIECKL